MPQWTKTHQEVLERLLSNYQTIGGVFTALGLARETQLSSGTDDIVNDSYDLIITWLGWKDKANAEINQREIQFIEKLTKLIN